MQLQVETQGAGGGPVRPVRTAVATDSPDRPVRVQHRRTRGWRMPENTISVTRPGPWGNPFRTVHAFRKYLRRVMPDASALRGKNLACWCPLDKECHADVWLEYVNGWGEWERTHE